MKNVKLIAVIICTVLSLSGSISIHAQITNVKDTTYWWNDAVFYEAFVRSFYDSTGDGIGDLKGLTGKLNYLNDGNPGSATSLNVDAVWLMPICPSPSYHGYDITDYKNINPQYGTLQNYDTFVTAAHHHNVKVIFDNVINHTSSQHTWFQKSSANDTFYRTFYRWSTNNPGYKGPWGEQVWDNYSNNYYYGVFASSMPDLNYYNQNVKDSVTSIADFWIQQHNIDGFRCDGAPYLVETLDTLENTKNNLNYWNSFHTHFKSVNPNAMSVGEVWMPTTTIQKYSHGQFDFCFEFNLAGTIISAINAYSPANLQKEVTSVYNSYPFLQFGTFLTNHDQDRIFDQLGGSVSKNKIAASMLLTFPGVPFIYYGEEVGMSGSGADQYKRRPMQWTAGKNSGFTTGNPWEGLNTNYASYNVATEQQDTASLWSWYRKLIAIRHHEIALRRGAYRALPCNATGVLAYARIYKNQTDLVLINMGTSTFTNVTLDVSSLGIPNLSTDTFRDALNNYNIASITASSSTSLITIPAINTYETHIYNYTGAGNLVLSVPQQPEPKTLIGYPNPANTDITIQVPGGMSPDALFTVFDMAGRAISNITYTRLSNTSVNMDIHTLAKGVYTIRMSDNNQTAILKVVKI